MDLGMNFVVILGPPAVGKTTVGYELAKRTDTKVFHNHMAIDPILEFFLFDHPRLDTLVGEFRQPFLKK